MSHPTFPLPATIARIVRGRRCTQVAAVRSAEERPVLVAVVADACRRMHSVPVAGCPFVEDDDVLLASATERLDKGLVNAGSFDEERAGRDPRELLLSAAALRPEAIQITLTHGDMCLPNLVVEDQCLAGYVDLGAAGLGDPWRDIALCARIIGSNWGREWVAPFVEACGVTWDQAEGTPKHLCLGLILAWEAAGGNGSPHLGHGRRNRVPCHVRSERPRRLRHTSAAGRSNKPAAP